MIERRCRAVIAATEDLCRVLKGMVKGKSGLNLKPLFGRKKGDLSKGETKNKNEMEIALLEST